MERVPESRFLALFGGQRLHRLQVEVVIQVQIGQVLAVDEQVQHVEALPTHLEAGFDPVDRGLLEEFGALQRLHEILFVLGLWPLSVQLVQDVRLEELLVRHSNLHGLPGRAMLEIPLFHERHVLGTHHAAGAPVERVRRPPERDGRGGLAGIQLLVA